MSIQRIHLQKLLRLFYADTQLQRRILREDIGRERRKIQTDSKKKGGDFHVAFWADAKAHVAGSLNLREKSKARIEKNPQNRGRLYPLLTNGFLSVWDEKVRWRNERFEFHPKTFRGLLPFEKLDAIVKIENVLAVKIWDGSDRAVYPYFSEKPALPLEGVRLGLWAMKESLPEFRPEDLRILDVLRGSYFRPSDAPLVGDEEEVFTKKFLLLLNEWKKLLSSDY